MTPPNLPPDAEDDLYWLDEDGIGWNLDCLNNRIDLFIWNGRLKRYVKSTHLPTLPPKAHALIALTILRGGQFGNFPSTPCSTTPPSS